MEDLVQYGTPLQSLDESNIHLSKAPKLSDQIVTDKQGKRRFHGAFTGGFAAGYFNSVGTKEGWTPSVFVSSRSKRADKNVFNDPKAFMDEEDLDDFGIASQKIQASSDFEDPFNRGTKRKRVDDWVGPIPGQPVLKDLLKPVSMTVGMKFLMKLGWRPGQGIGPRLSGREKRKLQKAKKTTVTSVSENSSDSDNEDSLSGHHNFAPDDVEDSLFVNIKSNLFGLGYKPLERTNVLGGNRNAEFSSAFRMTDKKKKLSIRGQAFGVGAFEEEDDDIYMKEDMSEYDFDLGPSGNKSKKRERSRWDCHISLVGEILEGFHLSSKPLEKPRKAPLPSLPVDYKPWHESYRRKFSHIDVINKERLTSDDRRHIVANSTTVEIRSGVKRQEGKDNSVIKNISDMFERGSEQEARPSSSDYKPFASNPEKQKRYEAYIDTKGMDRGNIFPSYMLEWEKEREKGEFQRAEAFNRPLSFGMSSRFTSAVHEDRGNKLHEGLNDMKGNVQHQKEERIPFYDIEMKEDMKAAKQKMFGRLTQCQADWHPDKLLCKRFNVPNPFPTSTTVGVRSSKKESFSIFSILPTTQNTSLESLPGSSCTSEVSKIDSSKEKETVDAEEDYGLKVPVTNPPTVDLFNAIFQDSSDSESEENEKFDTETESKDKIEENSSDGIISQEKLNIYPSNRDRHLGSLKEKSPEKDKFNLNSLKENPERGKNSISLITSTCDTVKSLTPEGGFKETKAKGIFRGIDFSVLNQYRSINQDKPEEKGNSVRERSHKADSRQRRHSNSSSNSLSDDSIINLEPDSDEEEYGPALPPQMIDKTPSSNPSSKLNLSLKFPAVSASLKEIERNLKKSKKKKSKHKHKHKKHKKESKHRR